MNQYDIFNTNWSYDVHLVEEDTMKIINYPDEYSGDTCGIFSIKIGNYEEHLLYFVGDLIIDWDTDYDKSTLKLDTYCSKITTNPITAMASEDSDDIITQINNEFDDFCDKKLTDLDNYIKEHELAISNILLKIIGDKYPKIYAELTIEHSKPIFYEPDKWKYEYDEQGCTIYNDLLNDNFEDIDGCCDTLSIEVGRYDNHKLYIRCECNFTFEDNGFYIRLDPHPEYSERGFFDIETLEWTGDHTEIGNPHKAGVVILGMLNSYPEEYRDAEGRFGGYIYTNPKDVVTEWFTLWKENFPETYKKFIPLYKGVTVT